MADKIKLFELDIDIEPLIEEAGKALRKVKSLEQGQVALKKSTKDLQKEIKDYSHLMKEAKKNNDTKTYDELNKVQKELKQRYVDTTGELAKNQANLKAARKEYNLNAKLMDVYSEKQRKSLTMITQTDGSIDQLSAALSKNKALYKSLSKDERENTDIGGKLLGIIKEQDEEYKKLHVSMGNTQVMVGSYEDSIKSAMEGMELFQGGTSGMINKLISLSQQEGGVKSFFKSTVSGLKSATRAGMKFIMTPIGAVIAAVVLGITLLTKAVSRNQDASDGFAQIWGGISNILDVIIGRLFKVIGALAKIFTGDWKGGWNQMKGAVTGFGDALSQAYRDGVKLVRMQQDLEKANIRAKTSMAQLNAEIEKYSIIQDDATRSFKEREKAAEKVRKLEAQKAKENLDLIKKEVAIVDLQVEQAKRQGKLKRDQLLEQAEAHAKLIDAEGQYTRVVYQNEKTRRELVQDRLERDLDILLDGYDNQKTINEKKVGDETLTFEKRRAILDETKRLGQESFAKQIETIQKFTKKSIDANALIMTSDAKVLNEEIRGLGLSEIMEGRLLEIIRDRKTANQDLAETQKDLAKEQMEFNIRLAQQEVDLYIAQHQTKLDSDIALNEESVREEEKRLNDIFNKRMDALELEKDTIQEKRELTLEEEQDFNLRKLELQTEYLQQTKDIEDEFKQAKLEQDQVNWELEMETKALRGESEFELQRQQLDRDRLLEIANAKKTGADISKINKKYALANKKITEAETATRRAQYSAMFGDIASLVGKNTAMGKAAAIAQASINTYQGITEVWSAKSVLPEPFATAQKVISTGTVLASGLQSVRSIKSTNTPKAEHGAVFDIGGNRHSEGGTTFYGEDGTVFEAEKDEKLFVLNRAASQFLGPSLSRLNESMGGKRLDHSASYLAAGGTVARINQNRPNVKVEGHTLNIDYNKMGKAIAAELSSEIAKLPNPVTDVKDIIDEVQRYNEVVDGASF